MFLSLTNSCAGRAHNIVVAERVALNFMQRMSGIATLTKVFFFFFFFSFIYFFQNQLKKEAAIILALLF
jgi:uncharacterized membrane protein (GlpM family)